MTGHKHKIVAIDAWVTPEGLNFDHDFDIHSGLTPADVVDKIKDATIVMSAATHVTRAAIENSSRLQLIACSGVGTDHVDKAAARRVSLFATYPHKTPTASVSMLSHYTTLSVDRLCLYTRLQWKGQRGLQGNCESR